MDVPGIRSVMPAVAVAVVPVVRPGVAEATAPVGDAPGVDVPTEVDVVLGVAVPTGVAVVPGVVVDTEVGDADPRPGVDAVVVAEGATCGAVTPPATFAGPFATGRTAPLRGGTLCGAGSLRSEGKVGSASGAGSSTGMPSGSANVGCSSRCRNT